MDLVDYRFATINLYSDTHKFLLIFTASALTLALTLSPPREPVKMVLPDPTNVDIGPELVKSESDKKKYKLIYLSSGLRALLIHDPPRKEDGDDESVMTGKGFGLGLWDRAMGVGLLG